MNDLSDLSDDDLFALFAAEVGKRKRKFVKKCAYHLCGREFKGAAIAKYCSASCRVRACRLRNGNFPMNTEENKRRRIEAQLRKDDIARRQVLKDLELGQKMHKLKI